MVMRRLTGAAHAVLDTVDTVRILVKGPAQRGAERALVGGDPEPHTNGHELPAAAAPAVPMPIEQWGLRLPDGNIVWENSTYQGLPLQSPQQREILVSVLRRTAADLNFEESAFLAHYGWARRHGMPMIQWGDIAVYPLTIQREQGSDTPELQSDPGVSGDSDPK